MRRWIARLFLRVFGWRLEGEHPAMDKAIFIAAPHTSNWDGVFMVALAMSDGLKLHWLGKQELFRPPWGWMLRRFGGIPVDRSRRANVVEQMAEEFRRRERLILAIPAEGTRKRRDHWKSGFYHMALAADVPVVLGFLDYARKVGGYGPVVRLTGDVRADMDRIRAFYGGITGKFPERFSRIRLPAEDEAEGATPGEAAGA